MVLNQFLAPKIWNIFARGNTKFENAQNLHSKNQKMEFHGNAVVVFVKHLQQVHII